MKLPKTWWFISQRLLFSPLLFSWSQQEALETTKWNNNCKLTLLSSNKNNIRIKGKREREKIFLLKRVEYLYTKNKTFSSLLFGSSFSTCWLFSSFSGQVFKDEKRIPPFASFRPAFLATDEACARLWQKQWILARQQ